MNLPTVNDSQQPPNNLGEHLKVLRDRLSADSEKQQLSALSEIEALGEAGIEVLMAFLSDRQTKPVTVLDGRAYQILHSLNLEATTTFLSTTFPTGLVPTPSERSLDYTPLQNLLVRKQFEDADRLTLQHMCELAGDKAKNRNWLYFSEVNQFPITDLQTIDQLWQIYSEGKFGFSVQRQIWLTVGRNWDRFWPKIGWRQDSTWTRYPGEFIWDLTAPKGHLPLSNQLRGVRVIEALMKHPAWE
ncbi:MAG: GUN4 N-terminal ARM-like repeat domain-containing protein [Cyanobacteria bacterium P01_A01_bin.37]